MFDLFNRGSGALTEAKVDLATLHERIGEALRDAGIDPESKPYFALFKMISDDVNWYFENAADLETDD